MQDLTFSDGTFIPDGTIMVAPMFEMHMDPDFYKNPGLFNPWRFSDMREEEGGALLHHFVSTSVEYVAFGHGKHAR